MLDLTKGSPLKQILIFSIPYLLQSLFQQLYSVVDMVIVGRTIDSLAYTAIGATGSISWFTMGIITGLTVGFSVLISQGIGSKNNSLVKRAFAQGILLTLLAGFVMSVFGCIFSFDILKILSTPEDIITRANNYIFVILLGMVFTALQSYLLNCIRAIGDSKTPLLILICSCLVNIILDIAFIVGLGMDTEGAGLATIISQIFSMIICVIYIAKKLDILHFEKTDIRLETDIVVKLVRLGLPIALTEGIISLGGIVMQFGTNSLGTMFITSHTTANKLSDFASMPLLSFSTAFAVFVGQNYGAKKLERIRDGIKKSLIISYCWCAILITIFIFFSEPLLRLLAGDIDAQILAYARQYLLIRSSFYVLLATLLIVKTTLQSLSRVLWPTISGFVEVFARAGISLLTVFLVTSQILNLDGGYTLICFANPLAWFTAILTMGFDFIKALKMLKNDNADLQ